MGIIGSQGEEASIDQHLEEECKEQIEHMLDAEQKYRELAVSLSELELRISMAEHKGGPESSEESVEEPNTDKSHEYSVQAKHERKPDSNPKDKNEEAQPPKDENEE